MFEQAIKMLTEMEEQDEYFTIMAKIAKKSYDALIEEGFTPDEAVRLVAAQGSPFSS